MRWRVRSCVTRAKRGILGPHSAGLHAIRDATVTRSPGGSNEQALEFQSGTY
jgi:hypothetical protein